METAHKNILKQTNPGYIEEKIKEENLSKWMKSNHEVDEMNRMNELKGMNQGASVVFQNEEEGQMMGHKMGLNEGGMGQPMKKKIPRKKDRSTSKSLKKREGESLSKNQQV